MTKQNSKSEIRQDNNCQSFKIVIIEDDEGLGKLIQVALQREGFSTELAETGQEALTKVKGEPYEILLVDYKLPDMSGKELIQQLIKRHSVTPHFITLTGYGNEKVAAEMMKLGSHEYIVKEPKFLEALSEVVKHVCQHVENEHQLAETRKSLEKNLELLKETGEMARVGGWEIHLGSNQPLWSDTTKQIHEVPDDYVPAMEEALDFFPGEAKSKIEEAVELAINLGKPYDLELPFVTARGNHRWIHTIGKPEMKDGKCIRLHGTFQDITRRKEAENELEINYTILKRTEKIAGVGSWEWDVMSDTVTWSGELFRIFKLNPEKGAPTYSEHPKIYTPESMQKLDKAVQKCLKTGEPYQIDLEIIQGDGNNAFCTVHGQAKQNEKGEVIRLFGSFQDITERKKTEEQLKAANQQLEASEQQLKAGYQQLKALNQQLAANEQQLRAANQQMAANEQQLRATNQQLKAHEKELLLAKEKIEISEERYRQAQEVGHIGSWEYNLQTEMFWGSDEGKRIYNLDHENDEFSVQEVMKCVIEQDRDRVNQAMADLLNENKTYDIIFTIIPKNTSNRKVIRSIAELQKDDNDEPLRVLGVLHDITLQKTIEKEMIAAKEKAEQADQLKSAFLANMSHEIRTPMNGILGFTYLLKNQNLTAEKHNLFIDIIQKSGNRMLETVNALIDISKIETDQVSVDIDTVDVNKELKQLVDFFGVEAKQKGLEFTLENQFPDKYSVIKTDKQKLSSIFTNLIKNAIKYTDKGFIKIGLESKDGHLHFFVKDSGIGVPENRQKAIFNRFEQADIKDTRAFQGSGLGLAIVKAYVEMLNGEVGVDSEEGKGSTFWVKLPLSGAEKESENLRNEVQQSSELNFTNLKTLIAEDDKISEQHLSILLNKFSREILHSVTGRETIELCKKHPDTDLILMDVKMPDINGYDATKEIRKFNNTVVIIAQTAYAVAKERERALTAGCDEYISKPIDAKELFRLIEKTLKEKKSK